MIRKGFALFGLGFVAATAAFYFGGAFDEDIKEKKIFLDDAYLVGPVSKACEPPTAEELEFYDLAVAGLDRSASRLPELDALWLGEGAVKFLGGGLYRPDKTNSKRIMVCKPDHIYRRVSDIITKYDYLRWRIEEDHIQLIARLPEPSRYITDKLASAAFSQSPLPRGLLRDQDTRPRARFILAGFGKLAAPYADQAFKEISITDSLGTSAAQVAAAGGHPEALRRVEELMAEILSAVPKNEKVPYERRNRLYELAHALKFAGPDAKTHTAPLHDLMGRRVASWQGHFGMGEHVPKLMCAVLQDIEGEKALEPYAYCTDGSVPFEGSGIWRPGEKLRRPPPPKSK